jgi:hypothetical protein
MKRIRIISSPRLDHTLGASEWRRYSNAILAWNVFLFAFLFLFFQSFIFYHEEFFRITFAIISGKQEIVSDLKLPVYYTKLLFCFAISFGPSHWLSKILTKPIRRIEILEGNFLDSDGEVFQNLSSDFVAKKLDDSIRLIKKGEPDFNLSQPPYKKLKTIKHDIFLPKSILELSWIVRGEAGSGKTVFTDRIVKETIEAGHKVVLHNIKGDEFTKLNGYCNFYLIEPWNEHAGYAINFLSLVARKKEEDRNAYIYSFVKSFCKQEKANVFFSDSALEVMYAIVKKVVEDEMQKPAYKATLKNIVDLWVSFNADTAEAEIDLTSPQAMKKVLDNKIQSLEKIKKVLLEKNPTQADLIDSNNAKTSLCILATCTKTLKKFEVLSKFWGDRELTKSLDLEKWLANPRDRKVLMLSNSNLYVAEAEAYISAVINLMTMFVINTEYKPVSELHFILDEFVQLSSIDLKQFMKLPDVGRGKQVRTKVVLQRTSQIKEVFDVDPQYFASAFQNKVWARMATDDFPLINAELGKQKVRVYKSSANSNKDGISKTDSNEEKMEDVINPSDIQKELGPVEFNGKFQGVKVLLNLSQFKRIPIAIFPPVEFPKKRKPSRVKSVAGNSPPLPVQQATTPEDELQPVAPIPQATTTLEAVLEVQPGTQAHQEQTPEGDPLGSAVVELVSHAITPEPIALLLQTAELLEAFETPNNNTNIVQEATSSTTDENKQLALEILKRTRKNKEPER